MLNCSNGRTQSLLKTLQSLEILRKTDVASWLPRLLTTSAAAALPDLATAQTQQADWADDSNFAPDPAAPSGLDDPAGSPGQEHGGREGVYPPATTRSRQRQERHVMRAMSHRHGVGYSLAGLPPGRRRSLQDYQYLLGSVAAARRAYLFRDILEEMALNGVPPDAFFFETAIGHCMRTTRVGDCFYYYEEMARRGMQPRPRLKGHLVSVLARAGRMEAATKLFREFQPEDEKESFELQLALCNSHGEEGDVAAVRAQLAGYMEKYKDIPNAVAFYYIALLKAYRKLPGAREKEDYAVEVLATLEEGRAAQAAVGTSFRSWQMPVAALMALQKNGYHAEAVALFETMDSQMKLNPDSWAYAHTVMSYVKDATGLFRRPQTEAAMRKALRATFHQEQRAILADAAQAGAGHEGGGAHHASAGSSSGQLDAEGQGEVLSSDEEDSGYQRQAEAWQEQGREGPQKADDKPLPSWVPRSEFSRLRFKTLGRFSNLDSWNRALELHKEMNENGLELPANELLEFIEASMEMEAMGHRGAIQVGVDLLDRFRVRGDDTQQFINSNVGNQLLRMAIQKTIGDLSLAHKLWDMLIEQADVPIALTCKNYLTALKQREAHDLHRIAQVEKVAVNTYGENYKHAKPTMPATSRAAAQHGQERQAKQQLTGMLTKAYQRQH